MLFFFLSGPFVEDVYGRPLFAILYFAGGIVAVVDGSRDTQVTVTNAAAPAAADQGTTGEATPAPPASSEPGTPATPPPASSPAASRRGRPAARRWPGPSRTIPTFSPPSTT